MGDADGVVTKAADVTIVEGLKRLKAIEKRIDSNCIDIAKYASGLASARPLFESEEKQTQEVKSLVQSSMDLQVEYLRVKRQIELTNLNTQVTIAGETRPISDWLHIKRKTADLAIATYRALNDTAAGGSRREERGYAQSPTGGSSQIVRYFKESEKNAKLREWEDVKAAIDGRLEVINATTKLLPL